MHVYWFGYESRLTSASVWGRGWVAERPWLFPLVPLWPCPVHAQGGHKVGTRWAQLARLALAQKHRMERVLAFWPKVTLCWLSLAFGNGSLGRKGDK